ncbi:MAG: hypothetical protein JRN20_07780 [Nitrososphaerota archaeon]|nr:hypothetical protein [Nitrososphaerota archaeon]MDG6924131.1 hypothetical protein [Nitrososphaerota archaeon]
MRTRSATRKQVVIRDDLHKKLRRLSFDNEIQVQDLVNLILSSTMDDEKKIEEFVAELSDSK